MKQYLHREPRVGISKIYGGYSTVRGGTRWYPKVRARGSSCRGAQNSEVSPYDFYIQCGTRRYGRVPEQPLVRFADATFGGLGEELPGVSLTSAAYRWRFSEPEKCSPSLSQLRKWVSEKCYSHDLQYPLPTTLRNATRAPAFPACGTLFNSSYDSRSLPLRFC